MHGERWPPNDEKLKDLCFAENVGAKSRTGLKPFAGMRSITAVTTFLLLLLIGIIYFCFAELR